MPQFSGNTAYDIAVATLNSHPTRGDITILTATNAFPIADMLLSESNAEMQAGPQVEFPLQVNPTNQAQTHIPGRARSYDVPNVLQKLTVPFRTFITRFAYARAELNMNRDNALRLINITDQRRASADYDLAQLVEDNFWKTIASATDVEDFYGAPMWCVPITSAQVAAGTFGHQGANPVYLDGSTASTCGGISAATYSLHRNWNGVWSNNTFEFGDQDVDRLMQAQDDTKFRGPRTAQEVTAGVGGKLRIFVGIELRLALARKARANNEDLGADIGRYHGDVVVGGVPVTRCNPLDGLSTLPMIGLDMDTFKVAGLKGEFGVETVSPPDKETPDVVVVNKDYTLNTCCVNRRRLWRMDYVT